MGEVVEKLISSYTASGNVKWYSDYGKRNRNYSKN
jgi:hypothetical protein